MIWDDKHHSVNNLSKKSLLWEIDRSLTRLQTDHIDIYQMHWPDPNTPLEETADALNEMKKAGKIRYVGLSNFSQKDMEKMMTYIGVDTQQGLYNMLERNTTSYHNIPLDYRTEDEMLPNVLKYGQAFFPYSPMFQGLLAGKFNKGITFSEKDIRRENPKLSGPDFEIYREAAVELEKVAKKYNRPMNEIAENWLRQNPAVTSIIGGLSSVEQLKENLHCLTWEIDDEMRSDIERIIEPFAHR